MEPELIYQDDDLIVVSKPAGMPVHDAKHSTDYTLCDWLLERFPEIKEVGDARANEHIPYRPGIVHRLDKWTSGVMVIARNQESFLRLKDIFKSRQVEKVYTALVCGHLKEKTGIIQKSLGRILASPTKIGIEKSGSRLKNPKEAVTEYKVLKEYPGAALLEVKPKTGRMHQIRVHLASIGHPVAGDTVYGGKNVCLKDLGRYFLHASSLSFSFREGQRLTFSVDLPPELEERLGKQGVAKFS
ncbi:MAG: RluA family pseudouridine synthase [Candidatus Sungbacteria bacterium]|uniref:Pseudouridine synthase n=1 Tax=Candidatus Sungiibacteriota bacterium TaxID=2750080 RepID=A0A931SAT8_9BACT|nr:RluA family pseudouridine synthase [Candidatus Sungbacteria bacterium]